MTEAERIQRAERLILFLIYNVELDPHAFSGARLTQEDLSGVKADLKREGALNPPEARL